MRDVHFSDLPLELVAQIMGAGPVLIHGDNGPLLVEFLNTLQRRMAAGIAIALGELDAATLPTGAPQEPGSVSDLVRIMGPEAWLRMVESAGGK